MRKVLFNKTENEVADLLGLLRENVRELRMEPESQIYEGEDWEKIGREIKYSEDGIAKLRQILQKNAPDGVRTGDMDRKRLKESAAATSASLGVYLAERRPGAMVLDAVVVKIYPQNPQYLEATLGDRTIVIRVRNNVNFTVGMVIESRLLVMKNERVFDFLGRCPRTRGRW